MSEKNDVSTLGKVMTWAGWIITILVALMLCFSASGKFLADEKGIEHFTDVMGYPRNTLLVIGILEVCGLLLYLIPQTAVLGAVVLTGYLGGAVATHVRVGDPIMNCLTPAIVGAFVWLALVLRDPRVRAVLPLR